ncbi:UNVERIFIED_CONTAM: two-component system sensor histidine kinase AgrC [Paenibacillus sp. PvR008]
MHYGLFFGTTILQLIFLNRYFSVLYRALVKNDYGVVFIHYLLSGVILYVSSISFFPTIVTSVLSIISTFLIALLYQGRFESKLIYSMLYLILGFIAESLSYFFITVFHQEYSTNQISSAAQRLFILFCSTFIMLFFIRIIQFIKKGQDYKIRKVYYLIMISIILISLFILNVLFFNLKKNIIYILSILSILGMNFLIVCMFDKLIENFRLVNEKLELQKQMTYQDNSYEKTAQSFKNIKRIIHDTKKQLVFIRACILEQRGDEAIVHINQTLDHVNAAYLQATTGNLVIDAMFSHALNDALDKEILFKHDIHIVAADIRLDRYDLCVVLGNVLDNAIEAAHLVPRKEDKFIHLHIFTDGHTLFIHVINSHQKLATESAQRTLKDNSSYHGLGLINVQHIAGKYGGYLYTNATDKQFETFVMFPYEEHEEQCEEIERTTSA